MDCNFRVNYFCFFILLIAIQGSLQGQFAPQVGLNGNLGIHKDSSLFTNWANNCSVKRGFKQIGDSTNQELVSTGEESLALGKADNSFVSLGDGGEAIISFPYTITNGVGPDFAIFENGFKLSDSLAFLELAQVSVSSNGIDYFPFESTSLTNTNSQIDGFSGINASKINNLAGKYIANYGTGFDLEDLKNYKSLDVNNITHIKLTDVVGSISPRLGKYDSKNNLINDPFPTPFPSSGFDLDAVGVIHQSNTVGISDKQINNKLVEIYPCPSKVNEGFTIKIKDYQGSKILIFDETGRLIHYLELKEEVQKIKIGNSGVYNLVIQCNEFVLHKKIIIY